MTPGTPEIEASAAKPVILVAGPTAAGKSGLALAIARAFDGVVINADSMQVYRELRILTARPSDAEMAEVPHRLYGVLSGREVCSAGRWRDLAMGAIAEAHSGGRLPVVAGGTGLYLKALRDGLAPVPRIPADVRSRARADFERLGSAAFHAELGRRDPKMAARLHVNDRQRLIRAWEVLEATGRSLADWQAAPAPGSCPAAALDFLTFVLLPPRAALYLACDRRFEHMVESGALDEVTALKALGLDPHLPVMKSLGVPDLLRYLAGELDLAAAIAAAQTKTRRYAKRQVTWLRHQVLRNDQSIYGFDAQYSESLLPEIFKIIRQIWLTAEN